MTAAYIVKAFGSGRMDVVPYVGHRIGLTLLRVFPGFILRNALKEEAKKISLWKLRKSRDWKILGKDDECRYECILVSLCDLVLYVIRVN